MECVGVRADNPGGPAGRSTEVFVCNVELSGISPSISTVTGPQYVRRGWLTSGMWRLTEIILDNGLGLVAGWIEDPAAGVTEADVFANSAGLVLLPISEILRDSELEDLALSVTLSTGVMGLVIIRRAPDEAEFAEGDETQLGESDEVYVYSFKLGRGLRVRRRTVRSWDLR